MQVPFLFLFSTIEILLITFGMLIANEEVEWVFEKVVTGSKSFCGYTFSEDKYKRG